MDSSGWPERVKTRLTDDDSRVNPPVCRDQGRIHGVDEEQLYSDRGAQQGDAARHSEAGVSEPAELEGHRLPGRRCCTPSRSWERRPVDLDPREHPARLQGNWCSREMSMRAPHVAAAERSTR
jgi:hypothetical protein